MSILSSLATSLKTQLLPELEAAVKTELDALVPQLEVLIQAEVVKLLPQLEAAIEAQLSAALAKLVNQLIQAETSPPPSTATKPSV